MKALCSTVRSWALVLSGAEPLAHDGLLRTLLLWMRSRKRPLWSHFQSSFLTSIQAGPSDPFAGVCWRGRSLGEPPDWSFRHCFCGSRAGGSVRLFCCCLITGCGVKRWMRRVAAVYGRQLTSLLGQRPHDIKRSVASLGSFAQTI